MKFIADANPKFWWPVEVARPDPEKAGAIVVETFEALFEAVPQDEAADIADGVAAEGMPTNRDIAAAERAPLTRVCHDWRGVLDEKDQPIPFSPTVFQMFLQFPWNRKGLTQAYTDAMSGKARVKN